VSPGAPAPVRPTGVLRRTRAAILDGAQRCLERDGIRGTTMGGIAVEAGVAKATLYNHFHTKDEVLGALVEVRSAALADSCAALAAGGPAGARPGLAAAVVGATRALSASPALRRVADAEPGVLARLTVPVPGPAWDAMRSGVVRVLEAAGAPAGEEAVALVLRHLLSHLLWPAQEAEAQYAAQLLERSLRAAGSAAAPGRPAAEPDDEAAAPGRSAPGAEDRVVAPGEPAPVFDDGAAALPAPGADRGAPDTPVPGADGGTAAAPVPSGLGWPV